MAQTSLTVFVIEDDASVRKALRRLIQSAGMTAQTFASAGEFLAAQLPSPDSFVLDVRMPGDLDGLELQRRLVRHAPSVPIVFITAHDDAWVREQALAGGAVAFLMKPFDDQELLGAITSAMAQRQVEGSK